MPIMPASGTNWAATANDGSRSVTMCETCLPTSASGGRAGQRVVLNTLRRRPFGDQRGFGGADHLRSAADQDLPVTPVAVFGDDVHQPAGLAYVQPARGVTSG